MTVAVLSVVLFWGSVLMVALAAKDLTPLDFLLGRHEPLPDDLGVWKEKGKDGNRGWVREERLVLPPGRPGSSYLLHQVRYRDPLTHDIVHLEPEHRVRRRRVRVRG